MIALNERMNDDKIKNTHRQMGACNGAMKHEIQKEVH